MTRHRFIKRIKVDPAILPFKIFHESYHSEIYDANIAISLFRTKDHKTIKVIDFLEN